MWLITYQNGSTRTIQAKTYTEAYLNSMLTDLIILDIKKI